jgi:hypothetical protein
MVFSTARSVLKRDPMGVLMRFGPGRSLANGSCALQCLLFDLTRAAYYLEEWLHWSTRSTLGNP